MTPTIIQHNGQSRLVWGLRERVYTNHGLFFVEDEFGDIMLTEDEVIRRYSPFQEKGIIDCPECSMIESKLDYYISEFYELCNHCKDTGKLKIGKTELRQAYNLVSRAVFLPFPTTDETWLCLATYKAAT
jgi:hypothetical protein